MTANTALLVSLENEIMRYCPRCRRELERGVTLVRVRGKKQEIVADRVIGARCADRKNTRTWMHEVPVVIVKERKEQNERYV